MNRKQFLGALAGLTVASRLGSAHAEEWRMADSDPGDKLVKTEEQWKAILSPAAFAVLRKEDTERAHTSPLNDEKRKGTYICAGCNLPLFTSDTKFDSGTGWPSFWAPIEGSMGTKRDFKLIWPRTEYHCIRCEGHQGHVFNDGPEPTGKRYCNNGVALDFVAEGEKLPELRT